MPINQDTNKSNINHVSSSTIHKVMDQIIAVLVCNHVINHGKSTTHEKMKTLRKLPNQGHPWIVTSGRIYVVLLKKLILIHATS